MENFGIYQNPSRKVGVERAESSEAAAVPILAAPRVILVRRSILSGPQFFLILTNFECSNKK